MARSTRTVTIRIETEAQLRALKETGVVVEDVNDKMKSAKTRAREAGKSVDKMGIEGRSGARGVLELSRAFEDLQFGIRGVLNNIPGTIMAFGGTAGLAGVISIAAVAADALTRNLGKLFGKAEESNLDTILNEGKEAADKLNDELDDSAEAFEKISESAKLYQAEQKKILSNERRRIALMESEAILAIEERRIAGLITDEQAEYQKALEREMRLVREEASIEREIAAARQERGREIGRLGRRFEEGATAEAGLVSQRDEIVRRGRALAQRAASGAGASGRIRRQIQKQIDANDAELEAINERIRLAREDLDARGDALDTAIENNRRLEQQEAADDKLRKQEMAGKIRAIDLQQRKNIRDAAQLENQKEIDDEQDVLNHALKARNKAEKEAEDTAKKQAAAAKTDLNQRKTIARSAMRAIQGANFLPQALRSEAAALNQEFADDENTQAELAQALGLMAEANAKIAARGQVTNQRMRDMWDKINIMERQIKNGENTR